MERVTTGVRGSGLTVRSVSSGLVDTRLDAGCVPSPSLLVHAKKRVHLDGCLL